MGFNPLPQITLFISIAEDLKNHKKSMNEKSIGPRDISGSLSVFKYYN
jgi:hypothetical protein